MGTNQTKIARKSKLQNRCKCTEESVHLCAFCRALVTRRTKELLGNMMEDGQIRCTCGWPEQGHTLHAEDCELEEQWDRHYHMVLDDLYAQEKVGYWGRAHR